MLTFTSNTDISANYLIDKLKNMKNLTYHSYSNTKFNLLYQSLLCQMPNESTQFPKKLIDDIINSKNKKIYMISTILQLCNKNYIYYNDILAGLHKNQDKFFIVYKTNFNDKHNILEMFIELNIENPIQNAERFYVINNSVNAVIGISDDKCILFINTAKFNEATIYHEFIHILQTFFNILFLKNIKYSIPTNNVFLNITKEQINEIFQQHELIPNIITLCLNVEDLTNNNYNEMHDKFQYIFRTIAKQNINIFNIVIQEFISNSFNINGLIILYLSYQQEKQLYNYLKQFILSYLEKLEFIG